eukprot:TRINITY_DN19770_c0_g1_i1.p2 TRINITY_DN19770_c0_g1~~TRINITY_DN19770_c0_g1_i1.p2  ORF type:complete len:149 (-),score=18.33 TRINITY_DN19770_c0_g1_i1:178-624(-)
MSLCKNLFVYGSLCSDEVLQVLINRVPRSSRAVLRDFHRYRLKERSYPAVAQKPGASVEGKVLFDISDAEKKVLDNFEDVEYEATPADVELVDSAPQPPVAATVYVWRSDPELLYGTWSYAEFEQASLPSFLAMCRGFANGLHQRIPL